MKKFGNNCENGNILLMLFAGVAMVGLLGVAVTNFMQGPLKSSVNITRKNSADNQMLAASKLLAASAAISPTGDCDADGIKEPPEWKVATTSAGTFPAGGGQIPDTLGAAKTDPWGTPYGYCGWDHGTKINDATCGGTGQKRLGGGTAPDGIAISMISAGPDKIFQTTCAASPAYVTKAADSDDMITNYTVAEMNALGGSVGGGTATAPANCAGLGEAYYNDAVSGHCYYRSASTATWEDAQTACQGIGGYLAVIGSSTEQALITNNFSNDNSFIGAKDDLVEGEWRWKGGELNGVEFWHGGGTGDGGAAVGGRYSNWSSAAEPSPSTSKNCALITVNGVKPWRAISCSTAYKYYCEKEGVNTATGGGDNLGDHAATKDLNMNGYKITSAAVPISLTDVANKAYVDSVAASGGGGGANAFTFTPFLNMTGNSAATQYVSNIVQVTGITGNATAVLTSDIGMSASWRPIFRICSDALCSTVTSAWGQANRRIENNNYIQIMAYRGGGSPQNNSITIGSTTGTWVLRMKETLSIAGLAEAINAVPSANVTSEIAKADLLITGGNVTFFTSINDGSVTPTMRLCSDSACASVLQNWFSGTSSAVSMTNSNPIYFQVRTPVIASSNSQMTISYGAGVNGVNEAKQWSIKTGKGAGYFIGTLVQINSSIYGNDGGSYSGGGRAAADAACYGALNTFGWMNKSMAQSEGQISASNIKAFICDQTACNNPMPNSTYIMGYANNGSVGGASFTTNASGQGPNDALDWSSSTAFSLQNSGNRDYTITNRAAGTGTLWGTTPAVTTAAGTCSNFTSGSGTVKVGYVGTTGSQRWNINDFSCSTAGWMTLICMVHPAQ